jgi:peptidoglycan/LPS O-acetylase OafA/YrhL
MAITLKAYEIPWANSGSPVAQPAVAKKRPEYLFIHTVRFWSMLAIVFLHCAAKFTKYETVSTPVMSLMVTPFKFGTIGFFLISGFLVGDRLPASDRISYLGRRAKRLIPAWLVWFGLDLFYTTHKDLAAIPVTGLSSGVFFSTVYAAAGRCLTETALWFIPNFMVALTCIVMLRRWLNDLRLGAVLLAVNLFYGVNVYTRWLPSRHTEALFAFVFYLWLGAWCSLRKDRILNWATTRSAWSLSLWACAAAGIGLIEAVILNAHNSPDAFNSLRFGNQIYSVLIIILLLRIRRRSWPAFVNVVETTYGVYLTHGAVMTVLFAIAMKMVMVHGHLLGAPGILLMWVVLAPTGYFLALQLTRVFASSQRWAWVVGASNSGPSKSRAAVPEAVVSQPTEA